ncbi:hypothetical protein BJV78DRAFT_1285798 [Lactifluus subvellereus]|nr:hypothetical protein BJV78DRAFT_1285798 [Lactifluus subvellereus]
MSYPHTHLFHGEYKTIAISGPHIQVLDSKSGELLRSTVSLDRAKLDALLQSGPVRCTAVDHGHSRPAADGDDKVWAVDGLELLSERELLKKPTQVVFTRSGQTIVVADKFGDVFSYPLTPAPATTPAPAPPVEADALISHEETDLHPLDSTPMPGDPFPGGANININLDVTLSSDFTEFLVNGLSFDAPTVPVLLQILSGAQSASDLVPAGCIYGLDANKSVGITIPAGAAGGLLCYSSTLSTCTVMGHTSLLTASLLMPDETHIITVDRDEHIRASWFPQGYMIKSFCSGTKCDPFSPLVSPYTDGPSHTPFITRFVSAIHIPRDPAAHDILVSGGGDPVLKVWEWRAGRRLYDVAIEEVAYANSPAFLPLSTPRRSRKPHYAPRVIIPCFCKQRNKCCLELVNFPRDGPGRHSHCRVRGHLQRQPEDVGESSDRGPPRVQEALGHVELLSLTSRNQTIAIQVALQRPFSQGSLHITTSNPFDYPVIDPKYLSHAADRILLKAGAKFARQIAQTRPLANALITELMASTEFHPSSTCAMPPLTQDGIVNTDLRVYGLANVRVADAEGRRSRDEEVTGQVHIADHVRGVTIDESLGRNPLSNLMAPTYGLAEQAADVIRNQYNNPSSSSKPASTSTASRPGPTSGASHNFSLSTLMFSVIVGLVSTTL